VLEGPREEAAARSRNLGEMLPVEKLESPRLTAAAARSFAGPASWLLPLALLSAACSPALLGLGGGATAGVGTGAMPAVASRGPSHSPTTDAQWSTAESAATNAARGAGADRLEPVIRVNETGMFAARHLPVEAGRCYEVGVAWAFDASLSASVSFGPGTNQSLQGFSHTVDAPSGVLAFCADGPGAVDVTFSATRAGQPGGSDLLEYAVVVGSAKESATARTARRKQEAEQARTAIASDQATEARMAAEDAAKNEKSAEACAACKARFQGCASSSCQLAFSKCTFEEANDTTGSCTR
jgi:hypothetical protein